MPINVHVSAPLVTVPVELTDRIVLGVTAGLILVSLYLLAMPGEIGGIVLSRLLKMMVVAGTVAGLLVVASSWGLVNPDMPWNVYVPALVILLLTPVLAAKSGRVRLLVRRRGVRPKSYLSLVSPKNAMASLNIKSWIEERRQQKAAGRRRH